MGTLKDIRIEEVALLTLTADRKGYVIRNNQGHLIHEAKNPGGVDSDPETNLQRAKLWIQTHG
jgi:hypothetical protein